MNGLDICSSYVLIDGMNNRPASWRMPNSKQMEKLASERARNGDQSVTSQDSANALPDEHWKSILDDQRARSGGVPIQNRRLSEIPRPVLRVSCLRCDRIVEIQTADAVRLYGAHAVWKDVGQRLLDNGCQQRTGSREDDGCWPSFTTR